MKHLISIMRRTMMFGMIIAALASSSQTAAAADAAFNDDQKKAIEQIVRDYLTNNPELITEMQEALQNKVLTTAITQNSKVLYRSEYSFVAGNPKGDVTVVEFFDYNCGFCKRALGAVLKLIETDKNVRVVFKELPIFGEHSVAAARVAMAAAEQGKYMEVHNALMKTRGQVNGEVALATARKLGLDMDKLEADMKSKRVESGIQESMALAQSIGLEGTPFYLVGDRAIPGGPANLYDLFIEYIADVRKNGCTATC